MAGFFGIGDFTKEGKGVDKNAPKKRGIFAFFELFFRKFWRLIKLNVLYLLACIPTFIVVFFLSGLVSSNFIGMTQEVIKSAFQSADEVMKYTAILDLIVRVIVSLLFTVFWGMGPVTAGYTYVLRNYSREEHAWLWSDFWQYTKENFKQAIIVWLIDLVMFVVMFFAFIFYSQQTGVIGYLKYAIGCMLFIYTVMHFYIYPIMVTFRLSIKDIYRNSFLFALAKLPLNVFVFIMLLVIHLGMPYVGIAVLTGGVAPIYWIIYVLLELLLLVSTSGFMVNFSVYPSLKKYMIVSPDPEIKPED